MNKAKSAQKSFRITSFLILMALTFQVGCSRVFFNAPKSSSSKDSGNGLSGKIIDPNNPDNPDCSKNPADPSCGARTKSVTILPTPQKVDVLIVADDSPSMAQENRELGNRLNGLVETLERGGADWQICYTTTFVSGNSNPGLAKNWAGTSSIILNKNVANRLSVFQNTFQAVGTNNTTGSGDEQGIAAINNSVSNATNAACFRADAAFATVVVSDEDEHSCGGRCQFGPDASSLPWRSSNAAYAGNYVALTSINLPDTLIAKIQSKWPSKKYSAHSIIIAPGDDRCANLQDEMAPAFFGKTYSDLSAKTGGVVGDICAANYANQLSAIGERIQLTSSSITLDCAISEIISLKIAPDFSTAPTINGDKVSFYPPVPEGSVVTAQYKCK